LGIATLELFERYGILAICGTGDRCWWENGVDAVECHSGDAAQKGAAFIFDGNANKVVGVDIDSVSGTIGLAALLADLAGCIYCSRQWGRSWTLLETSPWMMSRPVLVVAHKYDGLSAQPIWNVDAG
jgi:hypothetical protein